MFGGKFLDVLILMIPIHRILPFLAWPRLTLRLLHHETLAGVAVGLMVLPQGVAYAALAGMPLVTGIYASILPALITTLFSATSRLAVGPTALTCLLVAASLTGLAEPGSTRWVELAIYLSFMSGLLQVGLGLLRSGWLLNLVSSPVLMAFTQAAGVLIIISQLPALLGLGAGWGELTASTIHWPSALFGLLSLILLFVARRSIPAFPAVLAVVLGAASMSVGLGFEAHGGAVVGLLPAGLPELHWPNMPDWPTLRRLLLPTLVITLVSFLETASCAKVVTERDGRHWDRDQDLIGQGLGKIASGLCGAFPTSTSFSRSALNLHAGARSGWSAIASVGVVAMAIFLFMPVLQHVPRAVLAAIVLVAVLGMIKPAEFVHLWRISRAEAVVAGVTFVITLLAAPHLYWGVLAGMLMAMSHFLYQRLHPRIIEVGLHPDGSLRDRHLWELPPLGSRLYAMRMDAALDFASASRFEHIILEQLIAQPGTRHICLFAQPINRVDATGIEVFSKMSAQLHRRGITLHVSGMKLPFETALRNAGQLDGDTPILVYRNDSEAINALRQLADVPANDFITPV